MAIDCERALAQAISSHQAGHFQQAERLYRHVLRLYPRHAHALHLLGLLCHQRGHDEEALESLRRSIELSPSADFHSNFAGVLGRLGKYTEALGNLREAIRLEPARPEFHNNLGATLEQLGRYREAADAYQNAISFRPDMALFHTQLGNALRQNGSATAAIKSLRRALELEPNSIDALNCLAVTLQENGRIDEALERHRRLIGLQPQSASRHSDLLHVLHYSDAATPELMFEEHRRWAEDHGRSRHRLIRAHPNDLTPDRPLRIGYLSPDFRNHPTARLMEPLLERHDRTAFTIYCYSDLSRGDDTTARLRRRADVWRDVGRLTEEHVDELIRRDRIDILVDLAGHSCNRLLLLFARKPAPVQVTQYGYPDTTGLPTVDWRITDGTMDPPGLTERLHSEQLWRLPNCAWCYRAHLASPEVAALPSLDRGYITFGCLNRFAKVTQGALALWRRIMEATPRSRLLLFSDACAMGDTESLGRIAASGLDLSRVDFIGRSKVADYLSAYHRIDLALDTLVHCGGITTCDAMWMGVPVVTLAGRTCASRLGASLVTAVGLSECVADNSEHYVEKAVRHASDLRGLAQLRQSLRGQMRASPLCDETGFTRKLECAYREMWKQHCRRAG